MRPLFFGASLSFAAGVAFCSMDARTEKVTLTAAELARELQKHFRRYVADVRFVTDSKGEVALEVYFKQAGLQLRAVGSAR